MYRDILQQIGLPKNEAKIYEALISIGSANISTIAMVGKVNRRNVYDSLKNLLNRNLVARVTGPRGYLYRAAEPIRLREILNSQAQKISSVLPELKKLYTAKIPSEQAFISRGHEGIKNFWKYAVAQSGPVLFVGGKGAWHDRAIEEERKQYFKDCAKRGNSIQGIFDYEVWENGKDIYSKYDPELIRFFPREYSTKASYDICGNRVVLFSVPVQRSIENATVFNIISQPLADSYRKWFNNFWQQAKSLKDIKDGTINKKTGRF